MENKPNSIHSPRGSESLGHRRGICESLWISISQSTFHKTLVQWEMNRLQRKGSCWQVKFGNTRLNEVKLFSLLLGLLLVFSVLASKPGYSSIISQAYLIKLICFSECFSGLAGKTALDGSIETSQKTLERPQVESYRKATSLFRE